MKFVELHLDGFGKLVGRTFAFAPGLNLVFGPNEAGKSTLQRALLALLYGFYDEGSITRAKQSTAEALAPWTAGVAFAGELVYHLDDGQAFRAVRTFSGRPVARLECLPDDQDVSTEHRSASHGRLFFADAQLGMSKAVFENTCVVRQAELVALEASARAITDTLLRLSASASPDTTTTDALAALDTALRDEVGTDRAWTKPLAQARNHRDKLRAAQEKALHDRREAFTLIAEVNREQAGLDALDQEIARLHYLAALAEQQATQSQLDAAVQAEAEASRLAAEAARGQAWADFPAGLRDEVIRLDAERVRLARELAEQAPHMAEVSQQRVGLVSRLTASDAQVAALVAARDVPVEQLPQVQRLAAQWESAQAAEQAAESRLQQAEDRLTRLEQTQAGERAALGGVVELGPVGLAQWQQRWLTACQGAEQAQAVLQQAWVAWNQVGLSEERFQAVAETARRIQAGAYVEERPRKGCRFWGRPKGSPAPPPEAAIYAQVKPIRDRLDAARAEAQVAQNALAAVEAEARQQLGLDPGQALDPTCFEAAGRRLAEYTRVTSDADAQRQAVTIARAEAQSARRQAESARDALAQAVNAIGYTTTDLPAAVQSFEQACRHKTQYDQAAAGLQRSRAEERLLAQEEQAQARREEARRVADQTLRDTLAQANIAVAGDDLPGAVAQFEEGHRQHQRWLRTQDSYQAAQARLTAGWTSQEREAARKRLADLQRQLETWRADHPDWGTLKATHDAHEYWTRGQDLEKQRQEKRDHCARRRDSLQRLTSELPHPAELTEEIAEAQAQVQRLEHLRDVLTLARDELEVATQEFQRAFAPRLEQLVVDGLARVTQGRYAQVSIDPTTLAVALTAPERDEPVEATLLSTGTRDLLYLLLRIGISRLMSRTGEMLPLLLDDPLVQLDHNRREHTLQLLAGLAEETQIILFTKDDDIQQWFQEHLAWDERHRLHLLG